MWALLGMAVVLMAHWACRYYKFEAQHHYYSNIGSSLQESWSLTAVQCILLTLEP